MESIRAVHDHYRRRTARVVTRQVGRQVSNEGGDGRQPVTQLNAEPVGHHPAVRHAGDIHTAGIREPVSDLTVEDGRDEPHVVHIRVVLGTAKRFASTVIPLTLYASGIHHEKILAVGQRIPTRATRQFGRVSATAAVQHEHDWF